MKILHVMFSHYALPPKKYGGTERIVWYLSKAQEALGHEVRYLWGKNNNIPSNAMVGDKRQPIAPQIDDWPDIVHFHFPYRGELHKPYVCTEHGNAQEPKDYSKNTVFLSRKHALNHGGECFVYNGLDWRDYGKPNLDKPGNYFHFLGKATAAIKNLHGTVKIAKAAGVKLGVLGGNRLSVRRLPYFFPDLSLTFYGMVGGDKKNRIIRDSKGLIFPVRWHEPFGLAVTESLYLGCPVFATPYGSLPEIIDRPELGFLSTNYTELVEQVRQVDKYDRRLCHEVAKERFGAEPMAKGYMQCYEKVLAGQDLNANTPSSAGKLRDLLAVNERV